MNTKHTRPRKLWRHGFWKLCGLRGAPMAMWRWISVRAWIVAIRRRRPFFLAADRPANVYADARFDRRSCCRLPSKIGPKSRQCAVPVPRHQSTPCIPVSFAETVARGSLLPLPHPCRVPRNSLCYFLLFFFFFRFPSPGDFDVFIKFFLYFVDVFFFVF